MKKAHMAIVAAMVTLSSATFAQCDLPIPPGGVNLCSEQQTTTFSGTSNTITFSDPAVIPASFATSYTVTITYFDEWLGNCVTPIVSSNATMSASGSTITANLGAGNFLPDDFSSSFIINVRMISNTGGDNYFYIYYGACGLPLGNSMALNKQKLPEISPAFFLKK